MSGYQITAETDWYEVGSNGGEIICACRCGDGLIVPDKGLGRATVGTWKSRHQHEGEA